MAGNLGEASEFGLNKKDNVRKSKTESDQKIN